MATDTIKNGSDKIGWIAITLSALLSAFGWFAANHWAPDEANGGHIIAAILRTIFTLLPAAVGFIIANRRQQKIHRALAGELITLKKSLIELERIRKIEHELQTTERLTRVAKEAVKNTASSAQELFNAIKSVNDRAMQERLAERFRYHAHSIETVLSAVLQQMEESGISIYRELHAEESMHILDRDKTNAERGIEHARKIMESRGINDGLKQLTIASDQAKQLQSTLTSFKSLGAPVNSDG